MRMALTQIDIATAFHFLLKAEDKVSLYVLTDHLIAAIACLAVLDAVSTVAAHDEVFGQHAQGVLTTGSADTTGSSAGSFVRQLL